MRMTRWATFVLVLAGGLLSCGSDGKGSKEAFCSRLQQCGLGTYDECIAAAAAQGYTAEDLACFARSSCESLAAKAADCGNTTPPAAASTQARGKTGTPYGCPSNCNQSGKCPSGFGRCSSLYGWCEHDALDNCWKCAL